MKRQFARAVFGCWVNLESATDRLLQIRVVQGYSFAGSGRPDLGACPPKLLAVGNKTIERNQRNMTVVYKIPVHLVCNRAAARMANDVRLVSAGGSDLGDHCIVLVLR